MKLDIHRTTKRLLLFTLTVLLAAGVLLAAALNKQVRLSGESSIELHKKNASGQYEILDRARGPFNFTTNLITLSSGKLMVDEFNSDAVWNLTSEKGRRIRVRLARPAKVRFDSDSQALTVEMAYDVTLDGNTKLFLAPKLSNEAVFAPTGQLNAEKVSVDERSLTAVIAGFSVVKERDLAEAEAKAKNGNIRTPGVVGGSAGLSGEIIVVYRLRGTATVQ